MNGRSSNFFDARFIFGLAIIIAGALLLLSNMGYDTGIRIWDFWPVILILLGIGQLARPVETRQVTSGIILLGAGILFLMRTLDILNFRFNDLWPFILIIFGLGMLRHAFMNNRGDAASVDFINLAFILGGGDHRFSSRTLRGGKVAAIMGGGTIDLREADFTDEYIVIDTFAFWGGIEIKVPQTWTVNIKGLPILGGMENKTSRRNGEDPQSPQKLLIVKGMALMAGVEVKN